MSRGGSGRGGRGGGRGGFGGGRGGFSATNAPPMGLTFADIQSMSREPSALYPPMESLPVLTEYSEDEKRVAQLQQGFKERLRRSPYYIVESVKSTDLPRYSDKYRIQSSQPSLRKRDLNEAFFPPQIFTEYFNPRKKTKAAARGINERFTLEKFQDEDDEKEKSDEERSEARSQPEEEDYDVDEEYDNDYAENYFDNGEGDDFDHLDGGGGDEGGGGLAEYD